MTEESEEEVDEETMELAKRLSDEKAEISMNKLLQIFKAEKEVGEEGEENEEVGGWAKKAKAMGRGGDMMNKLIQMKAANNMFGQGNESDFDIGKLMKVMVVKELVKGKEKSESDIDKLLKYKELTGGGNKELIKALMENQQSQQQTTTQMIKEMSESKENLYQQQIEGLKEQMKQVTNMKDNQMAQMTNRLTELQKLFLKKTEEGGKLTQQLKEYKQLRDNVKTFAKSTGMVEKGDVVNKEGKVDWSEILNRTLNTAKEGIQAIAKKKPAQKPVRKMPPPQPQPEVERPKPTIEKEEPEVEVTEEKKEVKEEEPEEERGFVVAGGKEEPGVETEETETEKEPEPEEPEPQPEETEESEENLGDKMIKKRQEKINPTMEEGENGREEGVTESS